MDAVGAALDVFNKWVCDLIFRQLSYLIDLKNNYERLKRKVDRLHAWMQDVNWEISGKKTTTGCQHWLNEAEKIQNEWKEIDEEYQENGRCLQRWCHNILKSHLKLGKRMVALIQEIEEIEKSDFQLVIDEPPQIQPMPTSRVLEGKTSRDQTLQQLLASIKKPSVNRIGLWGMGGVGKTTIMKMLNNHPEISQMFEIVIWVIVSKEWTHRKVLKDLARWLKLEIEDGESDDLLKSRVFMELKAKKFLLLLDDVWNMIDLEEVGVPVLDEGKTGFKVLLSNRYHSDCNNMRTDEEINVKTLSTKEVWSLFRNEVGEEVADDQRIKELARKVAMECDGLPLAIIVVARVLRKETNVRVWRNALKELSSAGETKDMESKVYQHLKYSYDRLEDNSKECFLYCALFPEDWQIPKTELIQYWINVGLIYGWSNLEEGEDKGFSKLKQLIDASFLQQGMSDDFVKMHDVIRDMAMRISSTQGEVLVKAGVKLSELPDLEDLKKATNISRMKNDSKTLQKMSKNCGRQITLSFQENYRSLKISHKFFEQLPALKGLNLSGIRIESLPPSISSLANLQELYFKYCHVIPGQVGDLTKLEIFEMTGSKMVSYLPPEIGDLTSLKKFEVTCSLTEELQEMKMFPRLLKLSSLERLIICGVNKNFATWWDRYHSESVS